MIKKIFSGIVKYYAIFLNVVFAVDLGYIKYKSTKHRKLIRFWLLLQSLAIITCCLIMNYSAESKRAVFFFFWGLGYCSHYYFIVLILNISKKDISFRKMSADLKDALGIHDDNLDMKMAVTIILTFAYRVSDLYYYVLREEDVMRRQNANVLIVFSGFTLCMDMVLLNCTYIFYAPLCRLKNLTDTLKTGNADFCTGQQIYKSIVDVTEKYKDAINILYISSFLYTTFEILAVMSESVYGLLESLDNNHTARLWIYVAVNLLMSFAPALTAGLMTSQASKIKLILVEQFMEEIDPMREQAIHRFLGYIDARPLRLRMFRVFPLDTDLIAAMLHFTVQNIIVIVQFRY